MMGMVDWSNLHIIYQMPTKIETAFTKCNYIYTNR